MGRTLPAILRQDEGYAVGPANAPEGAGALTDGSARSSFAMGQQLRGLRRHSGRPHSVTTSAYSLLQRRRLHCLAGVRRVLATEAEANGRPLGGACRHRRARFPATARATDHDDVGVSMEGWACAAVPLLSRARRWGWVLLPRCGMLRTRGRGLVFEGTDECLVAVRPWVPRRTAGFWAEI